MNHGPLRVLAVVAVSAGAVGVAAWGAAPASVASAARTIFPPDGTSAVHRSTSTSDGVVTDGVAVVEYAGPQSGAALLALPLPVATGVLDIVQRDGTSIDALRLWQLIVTNADTPDNTQSTLLYGVTDAGTVQYARASAALTSVFDPPLVVLPADAADGETWVQRGDALPEGAAQYDYRATLAEDGDCHEVTTTLQYLSDGTELFSFHGTDRWCDGRGLVDSSIEVTTAAGVSEASLTVDDTSVTPPTPADGLSSRPDWSAAGAWAPTDLLYQQTISFFGAQPVLTDRRSLPVSLTGVPAGGASVAFVTSTGDLVGVAPGDEAATVRWRARFGGSAIALATVGDVVLVSTSERTVVAYDAFGTRLWTRTNPELVLAPPADTGDGGVVLVGLDASVTVVDALTGEERWTASMVTDADLAAVALDGVVVVSDRSGETIAFDATTGDVRWQQSLDPLVALAATDELVVAADGGAVTAYSPDDGTVVWEASASDVSELVAGEALVVVGGEAATRALDARTGAVRWTAPVSNQMVAVGEFTATVAMDGRVEVRDGTGEVIVEWPPPDDADNDSTAIAADGDGLLVLHGSSTLTRFGTV